jgi:hypothetical protein
MKSKEHTRYRHERRTYKLVQLAAATAGLTQFMTQGVRPEGVGMDALPEVGVATEVDPLAPLEDELWAIAATTKEKSASNTIIIMIVGYPGRKRRWDTLH